MPKGASGPELVIDPVARALVIDMLTTLTISSVTPLVFAGHVVTDDERWPPALVDVLAHRIQRYAVDLVHRRSLHDPPPAEPDVSQLRRDP